MQTGFNIFWVVKKGWHPSRGEASYRERSPGGAGQGACWGPGGAARWGVPAGFVSPSRPLAGATSVLASPNFGVIKTSGHLGSTVRGLLQHLLFYFIE